MGRPPRLLARRPRETCRGGLGRVLGAPRGCGARSRNRTRPATPEDSDALRAAAARLADAEVPSEERAAFAFDPTLADLLARSADRQGASRYHRELALTVDETRARFSAWYELFPRSGGTNPERGATLREAAARLPDIAAMGFDVLYLPPVHPIGHTARKGPNNSLETAPGRPGVTVGDRLGGRRPHRRPPRPRHHRGLRLVRGGGGATRPRGRARRRVPVLAGSSVGARAP